LKKSGKKIISNLSSSANKLPIKKIIKEYESSKHYLETEPYDS